MDYDYERPTNKRSWNSHNYLVAAKKGKSMKFPAIVPGPSEGKNTGVKWGPI